MQASAGGGLLQSVMTRKWIIFVALFVSVVLLDQVSKAWIVTNVSFRGGEIEVIPHFFKIVHAQNPGAMAGFLGSFAYRRQLFLAFTCVAIYMVVQMMAQLPNRERYQSTALGLIAAGAIGNAIDRVHKGTVTDFIHNYTDSPSVMHAIDVANGYLPIRIPYAWPTYNVADISLVVGVGLFLIHYLFFEPKAAPKAAPSEAEAA